MKTYLAALGLAAALAQPASATTFPTLTTIYVGSGVPGYDRHFGDDRNGLACSNVSGVSATLRLVFLPARVEMPEAPIDATKAGNSGVLQMGG